MTNKYIEHHNLKELCIMSYNIWFKKIHIMKRLESLVKLINIEDADIICLQEVTPKAYNYLIKELGNTYKYQFPDNMKKSYGCLTLSKHKMDKCVEYPFDNSMMGRSLLVTLINDIIIINTHFESMFGDNNKIKTDQYNMTHTIMNNLYDKTKNVLLCCDSNLLLKEEHNFIPTHDEKEESKTHYNDAWKLLGTIDNQYTFDSFSNIHLKKNALKYMARLDHIIFRTQDYNVESFKMLAQTAKKLNLDKPIIEVSDHFGVVTRFTNNNLCDYN